MCLGVRAALTPPYVQVMQRKTSLSQEQGFAGSSPALHTIYADDAKEDVPVSATGFCGFESRSAYHLYAFSSADRAPDSQSGRHGFKSHKAYFMHR